MSLTESIQIKSTDEVTRIIAEEINLKVERHGLARYRETRMIALE
jgi:hypothetical protein